LGIHIFQNNYAIQTSHRITSLAERLLHRRVFVMIAIIALITYITHQAATRSDVLIEEYPLLCFELPE